MRQMGSHRIPFRETSKISKEFWSYRIGTYQTIVKQNNLGFMQLLHNRYFEVLVDHKAIKYMIKSKTESPTTRLKILLLKLSKYVGLQL